MGTKERRERQKQELILETAAKQFEENGLEKLTIRSIAKEIEYSPRTIYLHFKDKDELLYNLSIKAFTLFREAFESVLTINEPFERLLAMNKAYFRFAFENPGFYDLMFILKAPMNTDYNKEGWDIGLRSHQILQEIVRDCQKAGYFKSMDVEVMAFSIWSYAHGVISLKIRDRMKMYPKENIGKLIEESFEMMHTMLRNS